MPTVLFLKAISTIPEALKPLSGTSPLPPLNNTPNPDDYLLVRKVDSDLTEIKNGITEFEFQYRDKDYNLLPTPISSKSERQKIRHITISFRLGSGEMVGPSNSADYVTTSWSKTFTPINLTY